MSISTKELFVIAKCYSRGDEWSEKFKVDEALVREAFEVKGTDKVDEFIERADQKNEVFGSGYMLGTIASGYSDDQEPFNPEGFGVEGEEADFGVGPTKQAAKEQLLKILLRHEANEMGGEDW